MAASLHPRRFVFWTLLYALTAATLHAQELPKKDGKPDFDFEPKLMLNDLPDLPLPPTDPSAPDATVLAPDIAKLESELQKAKRNAAWRERLHKAGVLSKVEAEQGALKIVRLTRDLETARVQALTREIEEKRKASKPGDVSQEALAKAETALAAAKATAAAATARWNEAQRTAAELRLQRERKLLAVGAGSRASVIRAEAALQALSPGTTP